MIIILITDPKRFLKNQQVFFLLSLSWVRLSKRYMSPTGIETRLDWVLHLQGLEIFISSSFLIFRKTMLSFYLQKKRFFDIIKAKNVFYEINWIQKSPFILNRCKNYKLVKISKGFQG